jgi:transformation/transcription domain-associated protein
MTRDIFTSSDTNEVKITRLKRYMESPDFLDVYFYPQPFLETFIPFAIKALSEAEPEKKAPFTLSRNEVRYTILRTLNKFSLKSVYSPELVYVLNMTVQEDNLPNIILAIKAINSMSKSRMMKGEAADLHMNIVMGLVHELFGNVEGSDENQAEMSLFALTKVLTHVGTFLHRTGYHMAKIDQFFVRFYTFTRRILENRRLLDLVLHKKNISIEMCSVVAKLLKYTFELVPVLSRMSSYYTFVPEISLIAVFYCSPDAAELRKEIIFYVMKLALGNKEAFAPVIDKMYTLPFFFSPDTPAMNVQGLTLLSELMVHFRDALSKAAYVDFIFRTNEVLLLLCHGVEGLCVGESPPAVEYGVLPSVVFYLESARDCVAALETTVRCFVSKHVELGELSAFLLRGFDSLCSLYKTIFNICGYMARDEERRAFKGLLQGFIGAFKEVLARICTVEKSSADVIVLSFEEIGALYSIFSTSLRMLGEEFLCEERIIEDFFAMLLLLKEHIASDILKQSSEEILGCTRRDHRFFVLWRMVCGSVILGNSFMTHMLPRITGGLESEDGEFVKQAMRHIVPFFGNEVKRIKRSNTFFMHRLISVLMVSQPENAKYFEILLEIFNAFGALPEKSSFFQKYIYDNFVKIVEHLMRLYEKQGRSVFIELIFALPISINLVETDIQFLIRPISEGLRQGGGVRVRALSILVYVLDFSTPGKINEAMEEHWRRIIGCVVECLSDSSTAVLAGRILGKLKTYHRRLMRGGCLRENMTNSSVLRFVVDGRFELPGHAMFFRAIQNLRGEFIDEEAPFDSEEKLVRFRKIGRRKADGAVIGRSFALVKSAFYFLMGYPWYKKDFIRANGQRQMENVNTTKNLLRKSEFDTCIDTIISLLANRRYSDSTMFSQYMYDMVLGLFGCYNTVHSEEALWCLDNAFKVVTVYKFISFYRHNFASYKVFFNYDTFLDALCEAFSDGANPLPPRILSVFFVWAHEIYGNRSENVSVDLCRTLFLRFSMLCNSSCGRRRTAGLNGILSIVANASVRQLVLVRVLKDTFLCLYSFLRPADSEDFGLPLKLALFILRFRYRGIKNFLRPLKPCASDIDPFTLFVIGLFDRKKHIVEFSKAVLSEILLNHLPQLLGNYSRRLFMFLKEDCGPGDRTWLIRQLGVFVFCVQHTAQLFGEHEMSFLIDKFSHRIERSEDLKGVDGQGMLEVEEDGEDLKEDVCLCHREDEDFIDRRLSVPVGGEYVRLSELSVRQLQEIARGEIPEVFCAKCKRPGFRRIYRTAGPFMNETEELLHWGREFYLLVVGHGEEETVVRTAILFLFRYLPGGSMRYLQKAYVTNGGAVKKVLMDEMDGILSGKMDYRMLNGLLCICSILGPPEDERIRALVGKVLGELKTVKEFTIIAQDSRYSMLARALELSLLLGYQEGLFNEMMETYMVLDTYVKSYTGQVYPLVLGYVRRNTMQFVSYAFKRVQEPSMYRLFCMLHRDLPELRAITEAGRATFALNITASYYKLEGTNAVDAGVFMSAYRFLELTGYEMTPRDINAVLGVYSGLRSKGRDDSELRRMFMGWINRFSNENLDVLFKIDPLFSACGRIRVSKFSRELSLSTLKGMLRSVDRGDRENLEGLVDAFGENSHLLVELFVDAGFRSGRLVKYCKENLSNANLRSVLFYYLCTFEPQHVYFEMLCKMSFEDRKYTQYCLERTVDAFPPDAFEELILIVLRSEVRFKTNIYVLFPLLLSRPKLISRKIGYELFGSIYKLLNSFTYPHSKLAMQLFCALYSRFVLQSPETNIEGFLPAMTNTYTLLVINFIHLKKDCSGEAFRGCGLCANLEALTYSSENINTNNVFSFLEVEMESDKPDEYKNKLLLSMGAFVRPSFHQRGLSTSFVRHLVETEMWDYSSFHSGMGYNADLLCSLLPLLRVEDNLPVIGRMLSYLCGEYNKAGTKPGYLERVLGDVFYGLSKMPGSVEPIVGFYTEAFKDAGYDISPLLRHVHFLISSDAVSLSEKIELVVLLDLRHRDVPEDVLLELCLPLFSKYRHAGTSALVHLQRFFVQGLVSANAILRDGYFDLFDLSVSKDRYSRLVYMLGLDWSQCPCVGYVFVRMLLHSYDSVAVTSDKYYVGASDVGVTYPWNMQRIHLTFGTPFDSSKLTKFLEGFHEELDVLERSAVSLDLLDAMYYLRDSLSSVLTHVLLMAVEEFDESQRASIFEGFLEFMARNTECDMMDGFIRGLGPVYAHGDMSRLVRVFRGGESWYTLLEYADDRQRAEIYRKLMESEYYYGLSRNLSKYPETMQMFLCRQLGRTRESQVLLEEVHKKARDRRVSFDEGEYETWLSEWVNCARELQQWDVCYGLGMHKGDCSLSAEAMWHMSDFTSQSDAEGFGSILNLKEEGFEKRFYELFLGLFGEYSAVRISEGLRLSIGNVRQYPTGSPAGSRAMLYLQMIVEMLEADHIFSNRIESPEALTSILFRFKDKEPMAGDGFELWNLFVTWRRHVCSKLASFDRVLPVREGGSPVGRRHGEQLYQAMSPGEVLEAGLRIRKEMSVKGMNEMARMFNMVSGAAIRRGYYDVALFNLKDVFDLTSIKVVDAFQKVVLELMCYLERGEYKLGAEQAGSTNIQHFSDVQCSILFNFRGMFHEKLNRPAEAERLYLQSVQICSTVGDNWLTWGQYLYRKAECWEEVFLVLTQAATHCSVERARKAILKLLLVLRKSGGLCEAETFKKILQELEISRFIFFVPQLIPLLQTENAELVEALLTRMSKQYPQAVLHPLRVVRLRLRGELVPPKEKGDGRGISQLERLRKYRLKGDDDVDVCPGKSRRSLSVAGSGAWLDEGMRKTMRSRSITDIRKDVPYVEEADSEVSPEERQRVAYLEAVTRIYNGTGDVGFKREFLGINLFLESLVNTNCFSDESSICRDIGAMVESAIEHVLDGRASPRDYVSLLNHFMSYVGLSSISKDFKDRLVESVFKMRMVCPLENIDEFVVLRRLLARILQGSYLKANEVHEMEVNELLHQSEYEHEVFGQYLELRHSYKGLVRVEMLEADCSYVYVRKIGKTRVHLRGSDGQSYRYELRVLERASEVLFPQVSKFVSEELRRKMGNVELRLFSPMVVGEELVCECVDDMFRGIDEIIEERLFEQGVTLDQCILLYLNYFASIYEIEQGGGALGERMRRVCMSKLPSGGMCPNARGRDGPGEDAVLCPTGVSSCLYGKRDEGVEEVRREMLNERSLYAEGLQARKELCVGCEVGHSREITQRAPLCVYKYEVSAKQRVAAFKAVSGLVDAEGCLRTYFKLLFDGPGSYYDFRASALRTYSTNTAFLHAFFIVDRRPENLVFARRRGEFMSRRVLHGEGRGVSGIVSRAYQRLFGVEGIEGPLLSIMYGYNELVRDGMWHSDLVRVVLEDPWAEFSGERFEDVHQRMVSRINFVCDKDNGTYNIISIISEWMDPNKLALADLSNISWI